VAVGDLQESGSAFADEGFGVMVAVAEQLLPLVIRKGKISTLAHGRVLHGMFAPLLLL
jgi:hypothetical protein